MRPWNDIRVLVVAGLLAFGVALLTLGWGGRWLFYLVALGMFALLVGGYALLQEAHERRHRKDFLARERARLGVGPEVAEDVPAEGPPAPGPLPSDSPGGVLRSISWLRSNWAAVRYLALIVGIGLLFGVLCTFKGGKRRSIPFMPASFPDPDTYVFRTAYPFVDAEEVLDEETAHRAAREYGLRECRKMLARQMKYYRKDRGLPLDGVDSLANRLVAGARVETEEVSIAGMAGYRVVCTIEYGGIERLVKAED